MGNKNTSNPDLRNPCQNACGIRCNEYQHTMNSECIRCPLYGALVRHTDAVWAQPVTGARKPTSPDKPTEGISTTLEELAREVAAKHLADTSRFFDTALASVAADK